MSEDNQGLPRNTWLSQHKTVTCFVFLTAAFFVAFCGITMVTSLASPLLGIIAYSLTESVCAALVVVLAYFFIRWLRHWRNLRRFLFGAACFATVVGLFYAEENWRGKRAWETCKRELEAKGEVLDWAAYLPPPVPDDQNFYKAPHMQEWFAKNALPANAPRPFVPAPRKIVPSLVLANLTVVPANRVTNYGPADAVLRFNDPSAREQAARLLGQTLGPCAIGARDSVLVGQPMEKFKPLRLVLQADTVPALKELTAFFPRNPMTNLAAGRAYFAYLQVEPAGSNAFRISLKHPAFGVYGAAEYLEWTEPQTRDFDLVRKALERPYARMDGDYQRPFDIPIESFVMLRNAAQLLSQRTICYLLVGQPDKALADVMLMRDLCRLLESKPTGKPMFLVAAMINAAITDLYVETIADGLRLGAWREPQLAAIQEQLRKVNLPPLLAEAFQVDRAAVCHMYETTKPSKLDAFFGRDSARKNFWLKITSPWFWFVTLHPRGWIYQNMVAFALAQQKSADGFDSSRQVVRPDKLDKADKEVQAAFRHFSPYTFLATTALPNVVRAWRVLARNQTMANEALVVCALERYRLAHGQYPETLDALVPQFVEKLPHDIIDGQPLKYRRTGDGQFLLYSVGWNEKDDGGQVELTKDGSVDFAKGDWVWRYPAK
jgi:hypothetical protein